jgi:preprotein translocase subunit SecF
MINFMKYRSLYFLISALVIVPGVISLFLFGLRPSIDFTGGTLWEVKVIDNREALNKEEIERVLAGENLSAEVQSSGADQFLVRTAPLDPGQHLSLSQKLRESVGEFAELRFETLGPKLGGELLRKALTAGVLAIFALLFWIAYRFKSFLFGISAILAVFHDLLVLFGVFSLLGHFFEVEVDTLFVTAVLTTLSFSVHDTIVVFDRIREIRRRAELSLAGAVNQAVSETLVRSLNNSLTIVFMLLALLLLGGASLQAFVGALLLGTITGTYSSTFNAAPLLLVLQKIPFLQKH